LAVFEKYISNFKRIEDIQRDGQTDRQTHMMNPIDSVMNIEFE